MRLVSEHGYYYNSSDLGLQGTEEIEPDLE
jgi:hypothetical protein